MTGAIDPVSVQPPYLLAAIVTATFGAVVGVIGALVSLINSWRQRVSDRALQVSQFRESWIREVGEQYANLMSCMAMRDAPSDFDHVSNFREIHRASFRLTTLIRGDDEERLRVRKLLFEHASTSLEPGDLGVTADLNDAIENLLEREWIRMRNDLAEVKIRHAEH